MDVSLNDASAEEYRGRLRAHERSADAMETMHRRLGYVRLLLVAAEVLAAWMVVMRHAWGWWVLAVPVVIFVGVAGSHSRVLRRQAKARQAAAVYARGLARMEDRWANGEERGTRVETAGSLYATDLDLVGRDGLFTLLCTARTAMGEDTLMRWLLAPATVTEVLERQAAVVEMREKLDLQERMATGGPEGGVTTDAEGLTGWALRATPPKKGWLRWIALLPAAAAMWAAVHWLRTGAVGPLLGVLSVEGVVLRMLRTRLRAAFEGLEDAAQSLQLMAAVMACLEGEEFQAEWLRRTQGKLAVGEGTASAAIGRLGALVQYKDSLNNPLLRVLNLPLLYSLQLALSIERWRRRYGAMVPLWLEAVGEMEAMASVATYSYEHRTDVFPTFAEGAPCLEVEAMGHPLLPRAVCVRNDVRICGETRVLLISGSNMSGKSTFMRSLGVAVAMAMCGAPVRAERMRMTPLRLGTSLLLNDSLKSGSSRFYAEIERLRRICDLAEQAGDAAVLFLLDELLQGTNSKDRLAGAEGVARELVGTGAIGVITTHDLAITGMGGGAMGLRNMHFQDEIVDGAMRFDFQLREGVVTKSNGVELMRLIGLRV